MDGFVLDSHGWDCESPAPTSPGSARSGSLYAISNYPSYASPIFPPVPRKMFISGLLSVTPTQREAVR